MKEKILNLLNSWKKEFNEELNIKDLYIFGSAIYLEGKMFDPEKSDLDIVILIPAQIKTITERVEWLKKLKEKKRILEKRAVDILEKNSTNNQIVSILPISKEELEYNIHKSESRNFFSINQFQNIETGEIFNGKDKFKFKTIDEEFVIQVLKSIQKARNSYLKNNAKKDSQELNWQGEDIIPKDLAREAAKVASLFEENQTKGDELNISFGTDYIKQKVKERRDQKEFLELYFWIDQRSGGRGNSNTLKELNEKDHLLFYELLFEIVINYLSNEKKNKSKIELKEKIREFLEDTEMISKAHPDQIKVKLSDIYVYPLLKHFDDSKDENIEIYSSQLNQEILKKKRIIISGEGQSGKTSICKIIYTEFNKEGYFPIYISDGKNKYHGNIEAKIKSEFEEQYYFEYKSIDKEKTIIILDDFHYAVNKDKILEQIADFKYHILVVDEIFGFNLKNSKLIGKYQNFKINEFSPTLRHELVKNWVLLSKTELKTDNEIYKEIDSKSELVDSSLGKIIGKGIMPSYPFFILSFISNYDSINKSLDQNITSQGYIYQTLIYIYLRKEGVKNEDFDTYFNFLTEFSYFLFTKEKLLINGIEFEEYVNQYKETYNLTVSIEEILKNLRNTNILHFDGLGNFSFKYTYLYYFFAAKYLAENSEEQKKTIEKILANLQYDEYAYIAIFITHHDKNIKVLEEIILNAMTLFDKHKPATLSHEELKFFDEKLDEVVEAVLPDPNETPENKRAKILLKRDEIEKSNESIDQEEEKLEFEEDELATELRRSIKTVEVMGRIIKNRAGSLKTEQLELIFKEGMNVHLRILSSFFDLINNVDSQNFTERFIARRLKNIVNDKQDEHEKSKLLGNDEKLRKIARNIFWNLCFSVVYSLNSKIIHSLGSNKLSAVVQSVCDKENTPATFIVKHGIFMWYNKNLQIDEIYDRIKSPDFSKTAHRIMDHKVVNHCQTHSLGYKEYQKVAQKSNIPQQILLKKK